MPEPTLVNRHMEPQLGVLYQVLFKPAPPALVLNGTAVRGK